MKNYIYTLNVCNVVHSLYSEYILIGSQVYSCPKILANVDPR